MKLPFLSIPLLSVRYFELGSLTKAQGFKGHPRRLTWRIWGNRRLCPFSMEIADNVINVSFLDTLVP